MTLRFPNGIVTLPWSSSSSNTDSGVSTSARLKRANALTAITISSVCSALLALRYPAAPGRWLVGFLAGLLWSNGFEYLYHRYLLHAKRGFQARFHLKHHATTDTIEEPEHVNLAASPLLGGNDVPTERRRGPRS
jgi:hypothetical protein